MIVDFSNSSNAHQLYFFSKEAEEVRGFFQELNLVGINNNNNNNTHFIQNYFNYDELAQKICVLTKKSDKYNLVNSMLKTDDALKIIMALLFKGFSWRNELFNHFNVSHTMYIKKTLGTLQSLKLVVKEKGDSLNQYYFEAITKSTSYQTRKAIHQADMYYITKEFVEFCSLLKDLFKFKVEESTTFQFTLKAVINDAKKFEIFYNRIMEEEHTNYLRTKKDETGVIYQTETLKSKDSNKKILNGLSQFKKEILLEKKEKNLLSNSEKKQLQLFEKKGSLAVLSEENPTLSNIILNRNTTTTYNGENANFDEIMKKQADLDKEYEKIPLEIGTPNFDKLVQKNIHGETISEYKLSKEGIKEYEGSIPKKSENKEIDDLFARLEGGLI